MEDEPASRAYLNQVWAEAMTVYRGGSFKLSFSPKMVQYLKEHQREFMPEDTKAGMIQAYLDRFTGGAVCSKQLYKEALNHAFDEPKQWEIREVNDIMNHCITGWKYFTNPRIFEGYGRQKGWERDVPATEYGNGGQKPRNKPRTASSRSRNRWSFPSENPPRCRLRCYPVVKPVAGKKPVTAGFSPLTTKATEK